MSVITLHSSVPGRTPGKLRQLMQRLRRDPSATSAVELGLSLPFLMGLALTGAEVVSLAIVHVKLNQLAITVADNASRAKQTQVNGAPQFREFDVNQVFRGAALQAEVPTQDPISNQRKPGPTFFASAWAMARMAFCFRPWATFAARHEPK